MWVSRRSMHPTHRLICAQVAGCTPQEQWDNIPLYGKLQIFVLVGMLESYGEGASQSVSVRESTPPTAES